MEVLNKVSSAASWAKSKVDSLCIATAVTAMAAMPPAMAQSVDPFTTAMETATGKVETYAAALVGLAAVSVVFFLAIKFVKKIPRAA